MFEHYFSLLEKDFPESDQVAMKKLLEMTEYYFSKVHTFNFTGHKTPETFFVGNVLDSILPALHQKFSFKEGYTIADLGTGGGFPGVPLALLYPHVHFTLIDSVQKKLSLIEEVCAHFSIQNVKTQHARLEEVGQDTRYREQFDVVTAKALAHWPTLLEYCLPLVKIGGQMAVYTSVLQQDEVMSSEKLMSLLGGKLHSSESYILPNEFGLRYLTIISKVAATPEQYPRKVGIPKEKPLLLHS